MIQAIAFFEFLIILWLLFERDGLIRKNDRLEGRAKRPDVMGKSRYKPKRVAVDDEVLR